MFPVAPEQIERTDQKARGLFPGPPVVEEPAGLARFWRRLRPLTARRTAPPGRSKVELLSLAFGGFRQQRQLIQPLLQLRRRLRHRRASGKRSAQLCPRKRQIFQRAQLRHNAARVARAGCLDQLGRMGFERFRDPGMELLQRTAQQSAVGGILDEGVLEQVFGCRRRSALKDQARASTRRRGRLLEPFFETWPTEAASS